MILRESAKQFGGRSLESALWVVAALCFGTLLQAAFTAAGAMRDAQEIEHSMNHSSGISSTGAAPSYPSPRMARIDEAAGPQRFASAGNSVSSSAGQVFGRIEIPALKLIAPITSGVESSSLMGGVGHVDGSALPGGLGTIILAGHRDTFLRPLEHVAKGMEIRIIDRTGAYRYSVDRWEIVMPEEVDAVSTRSRPELALVTCYPFHYIGAAPKRFIVHASLLSLIPDPPERNTPAQ